MDKLSKCFLPLVARILNHSISHPPHKMNRWSNKHHPEGCKMQPASSHAHKLRTQIWVHISLYLASFVWAALITHRTAYLGIVSTGRWTRRTTLCRDRTNIITQRTSKEKINPLFHSTNRSPQKLKKKISAIVSGWIIHNYEQQNKRTQ